jgi:hypothetical protein
MTIVEMLTMAEFEEINALNGKPFEEVYGNGLPLGRPAAVLAWILERRTTPAAKLDDYMAMNQGTIKTTIEKHTDPKD